MATKYKLHCNKCGKKRITDLMINTVDKNNPKEIGTHIVSLRPLLKALKIDDAVSRMMREGHFHSVCPVCHSITKYHVTKENKFQMLPE